MGPGQNVVAFGECMLELQGQAFGAMQQTFGGDTLNTAVYLARCGRAQGLQVAYATAVGEDPLSQGLLDRWQAEGIGMGFVRRLPGRLPGLYLIEVDDHGERRFSYWRDQSAARAYFDAPTTPLENQADEIDALYLSGISLAILPAAGRERLFALAERLRARGAQVVFDNNYRPRLWHDAAAAREAFGRILSLASIALLTLDDEMGLWGNTSPAEQLASSLALPCPEVVIKRGAEPTLLRLAGQALISVATEPVETVVDTTAAGDSFAGAYLATRFSGGTPESAARAGNSLAARVIQHRGALIPLSAMKDLNFSARKEDEAAG